MSLATYRNKRHFKKTPEPTGGKRSKRGALRFVVQKHDASRLHYDFRLELDGVLKSWAVPKGPSLRPADRRLAVMVEDHPLDYRTFEGIIPEGNYGAGSVIVWDEGTYHAVGTDNRADSEAEIRRGLEAGRLSIELHGQKLRGAFSLVRMRRGEEKNWLLMKKEDDDASDAEVTLEDRSVRSGRTVADVANKKSPRRQKPARPRAKKSAAKTMRSRWVKPMLATLVAEPFDRQGWLFEVKWDGYRAIAEVDHGSVRLYSRSHQPFEERFAPVVKHPKKLDVQAVLDGEIVVVDKEGIARFQLLQTYQRSGVGPLLYYVFDIPVEIDFSKVVEVALTVKRLLDAAQVKCCCKTSGKRGLHIYVPLGAQLKDAEARQFAEVIARFANHELPEITSLERSPSQRRGRVYLDYLQNRRAQTVVAPYSARPAPGATVSTPLHWREVNKRLDPSRFTIKTIPARIQKVGDLWKPVLGPGVDVLAALRRLGQ